MQKLDKRNTYTPFRAAPADRSVAGQLKRNTVKEVKGFKRFDKVRYNNKECFVHGLRSSGYFDIRSVDGSKIGASVDGKKLTFLEKSKRNYTGGAIPPRPCGRDILAQLR